MIPILVNLFYFAVFALVVAAGVYLYRTRDQAAAADEVGDEADVENDGGDSGEPDTETDDAGGR
jgi:hypothetical protein